MPDPSATDRSPEVDPDHVRPAGIDDATVEAVGKVTEALEWVERARGRLYDFHQLMGHADLLLGDAVDALRAAGHDAAAEQLRLDLVGRNVLDGRWTYQIVEEFDDTYWTPFRDAERSVRELTGGLRHVFEAEMKARRRSDGHPHHDAAPPARDETAPPARDETAPPARHETGQGPG